MNAHQLFNQAKAKADKLPDIVRTPMLIQSVMMAEVSKWIVMQDASINAEAILRTANFAVDLIDNYMADKIL